MGEEDPEMPVDPVMGVNRMIIIHNILIRIVMMERRIMDQIMPWIHSWVVGDVMVDVRVHHRNQNQPINDPLS